MMLLKCWVKPLLWKSVIIKRGIIKLLAIEGKDHVNFFFREGEEVCYTILFFFFTAKKYVIKSGIGTRSSNDHQVLEALMNIVPAYI